MTWGWRLGGTLVVSGLLALSAPVATAAQPIGQPVPPVGDTQSSMSLQVTSLTPRIVTAGTGTVTVEGKVTNTGDRRIDQIRVRLQRGDAMDSDKALRDIQGQNTDVAIGGFQNIGKTLEPGDSTEVSVSIAVTGDRGTLRITEPGVYPLLVNVNGRPDFSSQARLAAVSVPLPVMSVPGGSAASPKPGPPEVSLLWPLLDERPRQLPSSDGTTTLLADDDLADSLAVGGRLFNLVNAVRTATATDTELLRSICFVIDPDLLATVVGMTRPYQVQVANGPATAGRGEQAATDWLERVRELARGHCVVAVPYADADLVALSRAGAVDLAQLALAGASIVNEQLGVQPMKNVYWPAGGSFDQRTLLDLANVGSATVLADPAHLQRVEGRAPYTVNGSPTANPIRALPVDSLISDALATGTPAPDTDATGGSVQNGLAALAYRAAFDRRDGGQVLIAPPRRWLASSTELDQFLALTRQLIDDGFVTALPLEQLVAAPDGGTVETLAFTPQDSAQEIPTQVTAEVMRINATKRDLLDAMADDNTNSVDPADLLTPIQYGLLRAVSTAWRGHVQEATETVGFMEGRLDGLRDVVVVNDPARPLSLASGDSPIPIRVYNGLPVTIVVRVNMSPVLGLRTEAIQDIRIPPLSSTQRYIPAEVSRSGRFSVDIRLTTPGGTPLGKTVRLELNSTSYGIISVAVTGTAGAVLVLLVGFRIFRRVRAARAGEAAGTGSGEEIVEP
ncbi:DUF6049 family protein [Actinophytocola oryzae]|uniref:Secreted protein n=1 Tax=Actinophytocola oryzae TaxID=502181 RepID=A0A4R7VN85_9PSEU|nr:DUF6049 family protein [Actinophytocola oryzae]TDV50805.1 hypothetical protein CLV71_106147 [Actinophytocola oryzae]